MGVFFHSNSFLDDVESHVQIQPEMLRDRILKYGRHFQPDSVEMLNKWGLDFYRNLIEVDGRRLGPQTLLFGGGRTHRYVCFAFMIFSPIDNKEKFQTI